MAYGILLTANLHAAQGRICRGFSALGERGSPWTGAHSESLTTSPPFPLQTSSSKKYNQANFANIMTSFTCILL